jgi:hypothetical protein
MSILYNPSNFKPFELIARKPGRLIRFIATKERSFTRQPVKNQKEQIEQLATRRIFCI